ncbi:MAG: membrane integrity-associated transporter subunit PqiC [Qingshengfaniella sp.]
MIARSLPLALPLVLTTLVMTACSSPNQVLIPPSDSVLRLRPLVGSLEIRDVSLPRYAAADPIMIQAEDGTLREMRRAIWADDPERGMTLQLASTLATITGARVAAEPWPFSQPADANVTVRIEQVLAQPDGLFHMTGQYAIAGQNGGLADRAGPFDISVPLPDTGPTAVATAQGQALTELAETIARRIAR